VAKSDWEKIWESTDIDLNQDKNRLEKESETKKLSQALNVMRSQFGEIKGLKTVEIGSGLGDFSIIMNKLGAKTTLVDYSPEALKKAEARFNAHGLKAEYIQADMLKDNKPLRSDFDVSFSFGLVEHFYGEDRQTIVTSHATVLRPGGLTFISIPYRYSLPYRLWMKQMKDKGTWPYGLEVPFSKTEIIKLGKMAGLKRKTLIQSSVFADINTFFPVQSKSLKLDRLAEKPNMLDVFGYALIYVGEK
jgi:cyclopropane fatty-acyl-phospholipid synthase-like methyltransferase